MWWRLEWFIAGPCFAKFLGELSGIVEWLIASLGVSALLVLALPASPMAQLLSCNCWQYTFGLVGVSATIVIQKPLLTMPITASLAIYSNITGNTYPNKPNIYALKMPLGVQYYKALASKSKTRVKSAECCH